MNPRTRLDGFGQGLPHMLDDLSALVSCESPSDDAARVTALARWVRDRLRSAGVEAETRPCPPRGEALLAGAASGGTLLLGHHDTVWPVGTLADLPFRIEGGRATGPGVFDMKAGIVVAIAVLESLAREKDAPATALLLTPDEEVGTAASRELLLEVARRHRRVLVLEPSLDGAAKVARKGTGLFSLRFRGRAAHAGLEPEKGASALAELARCVPFLESLADVPLQTTVTPTVARAGDKTNVVPETASLEVDVRVWSAAEAARVEREIRGRGAVDPRVALEVAGGFDRPPMEASTEATALFERARALAALLGFPLEAARVGGASDGNLTAAAGLPTLDGLGPLGGGAHARDEFVRVDDLPRRAALVAALASSEW